MGSLNADVKNEDVKFVGPALLREEGGDLQNMVRLAVCFWLGQVRSLSSCAG